MNHFFKCLATALLVMLLSGCQTPLQRGLNVAYNLGQMELDEGMVHRNVAGTVIFDEGPYNSYSRASRNNMYLHHLEASSDEIRYRLVPITLRHTDWAMYIGIGELGWATVAIIPDHVPQLHEGDTVEIRHASSLGGIQSFMTKGDGNVVLRVLCAVNDPDFALCLNKTPRLGPFEGYGATGTLYPASAREYGFTFTPKYDMKGNAIRDDWDIQPLPTSRSSEI